jgi:oleate hydratase
MNTKSKAYLVGGGIGSLAAAAFMIRDGGLPGENVSILEAAPVMGGSLDGARDPAGGYSMRGGRMLTTDNYECTWDLYKSIPSLNHEGQTVFDETVEFNERHKSNAMARLVDSRRAKVSVTSMGFSMEDRIELLKLSQASEDTLGASCITDWLSPGFFETEFWYMWATTFAFQPWHSAVEFRRYLHRFLLEFSRIETLAGVKRTIYNQYESLVLPLQAWLTAHGVRLVADCKVTDLDHKIENGKFIVTGIHCLRQDTSEAIAVNDGDFVFMQNGSMTDASSLGSMTSAPSMPTKADSGAWTLWEKLAQGRPEFGNPAAFNSCIAQSFWSNLL